MHPAKLLLETLRLRGGPDPAQLCAAWATVQTQGLARLISFEGSALWLYRRLRQIGAEGTSEPAFTRWLERCARNAAARNLLVDAQTEVILRFLDAEGVSHVLLKGMARRAAARLYPFADARTTNDVDVLVPAARAGQVWDRLRTSGYNYALRPEDTPPGHYHLPPLHDGARVAVEFHTSTSRAVPPEQAWRRATAGARELEFRGLVTRVPSPTELLWHGITHAMSHESDAFRLQYLQDAAVICASDADVDWEEIRARLDSDEIADRRRTARWLGAAAWIAGTTVPDSVSAGVAPFDLARTLRWRLAVARRVSLALRIGEKLLDEGTRAECGMRLTPAVSGTSLVLRCRRRAVAGAARATYCIWRTARG